MQYNPHTKNRIKLEGINKNLHKEKKELIQQIIQDIGWFENHCVDELEQEFNLFNAQIKQNELEISVLEKEILELNTKVKETEPHIKSMLNPFNWFSSEQIECRQEHRQLTESIRVKKAQELAAFKPIKELKSKSKKLKSILSKYKNLDLPKETKKLGVLIKKASRHRLELKKAIKYEQKVDLLLGPVISQMAELDSKRIAAEKIIQCAQNLDDKMSSAANSYERAMLHQECEKRYGVSSPRELISKQKKIIYQINRDYSKLDHRAVKEAGKGFVGADFIIIDGNNMCYVNQKFFGLRPLQSVTEKLHKKFKVHIIFDAGIRGLLRCSDQQIIAKFMDSVEVHIVATGSKADETILDLASISDRHYILSNDRFGEYNDKEVVKNNRIIRHEIFNNKVLVHELDINITF